jgi:hypothetical protein
MTGSKNVRRAVFARIQKDPYSLVDPSASCCYHSASGKAEGRAVWHKCLFGNLMTRW